MSRIALILTLLSPWAALLVTLRTGLGSSTVLIVFFLWLVLSTQNVCFDSLCHKSLKWGIRALEELLRDGDFTLSRGYLDKFVDPNMAGGIPGCTVVVAQPARSHVLPLASFKAYVVPLGDSLMIVHDPPGNRHLMQEFVILHEIGHISVPGAHQALLQERAWLRLAASYVPCALLCSNTVAKIFIAVAWSICTWVDGWEAALELNADAFAIGNVVKKYGREESLKLLSSLQNTLRRRANDLRPEHYAERMLYTMRGKALSTYTTLLEGGHVDRFVQEVFDPNIPPPIFWGMLQDAVRFGMATIAMCCVFFFPRVPGPTEFWLCVSSAVGGAMWSSRLRRVVNRERALMRLVLSGIAKL